MTDLSEITALREINAKLLAELKGLLAMVEGECPSLLEDHHQHVSITSVIAEAEKGTGVAEPFVCANCGSTTGVELESSRTAYAWDGQGVDPNANVPLCRPCAEQHHEYWDEQWANVPH